MPNDVEEATRKRMYLSKAQTLQECQRKYFFQHKRRIKPRTTARALNIGRLYHEVAETYVRERDVALPVLSLMKDTSLSEEDRDKILDMYNCLIRVLVLDENQEFFILDGEQRKPITILGTERALSIPINDWDWYIKTDLMIQEGPHTYMVDHKTTSGYGAATAKYYHNSPQTQSYLTVLLEHFPRLRGCKFLIITKTKEPKMHLEDILVTHEKIKQARLGIENTIELAAQVEETGTYPRSCTRCVSTWQECSYFKLCYIYNPITREAEEGINFKYVDEVLQLFEEADPDEHLKLEEV